ncbi:MAG: hypothetical protein KDD69_18650 [Bdellovibrionales bacterium]|nr:hypothetical protein [Bdellovibrionales bacterium]
MFILGAVLEGQGVREACATDQYLMDGRVATARHDRRTSSQRFQTEEGGLSAWGMLFEESIWNTATSEEKQLLQYEELPSCQQGAVELEPLLQHTPGTEKTDVLYYAPTDPEQVSRARQYRGFKVPYNPALLADPKTNLPNEWQAFARFIQVDCLPLRFRFAYVGSQRYMEFRRGTEAWKE